MPASGSSKPAIIRSVVVFPEPDGPEHREELARADLEVHAAHGDDVAVLLAQAAQDYLGFSRYRVLLAGGTLTVSARG